MKSPRVIIIGAGPAGLSTLLALRAKGIDARVYERAREMRPIGAGLTLFPNGLAMLEKIHPGLPEALIAAGSGVSALHMLHPDGTHAFSSAISTLQHSGWPMLNLRWSRLQEVLAQRCPKDRILLDHPLVGIDESSTGVTAVFEGGIAVEGDLVIGADGVGSTVRRLTLNDGPPRYAGRLSWRGVVPSAHPDLKPCESMFIMSPQGKTFAAFDIGGGETFWSAGVMGPDTPAPVGELKARVQACFEGWAPVVVELIKATDASGILERALLDRPPCPTWSRGRVTLVGDAAHPMVPSLGQGANTAFEDAWVLAQCLAEAPTLPLALEKYEAERIPRAQIIQARSARQGARAYDPDSEWYRDGVLKAAALDAIQFDDWLYRYEPRVLFSSGSGSSGEGSGGESPVRYTLDKEA